MPVKVYDGTNWVTVAGDGQAGAPGAAGTSSSIATWVKTASGGETSVSGTGDTGYGTLAYTVGQELVYLNGVLLDRGDDYTATNGTSITGLTALTANDVVTVWTVNSFSVANTYTQAQSDDRYPAKAGSVLQVVSATTTTQTAVTGTTFTDTNISLAITPTSTTSKILVLMTASCSMYSSGSVNQIGMGLQLLRGGTTIWAGNPEDFYITTSYTGYHQVATIETINYLDSPATISATTYKLQIRASATAGTARTSDNSRPSSIILMEIGA